MTVVGSAALGVGVVVNPWLLAWIATDDGHLGDGAAVFLILAFEAFAIVVGAYVLAKRETLRPRHLLFGLVTSVLLVLIAVLLDRALGLVGVPSEFVGQVAHPPNYREVRKTIEFEYTFETNELGLRYPPLPATKPQGEFRVFVVGDSFTEGYGVAHDEMFTARMEAARQTENVRFINGGLAGTGPVEYLRIFSNVGLGLDLDALLVCVYTNDVRDTPADVAFDVQSAVERTRRLGGQILHTAFPHTVSIVERSLAGRARQGMSSLYEDADRMAKERKVSDARRQKWEASIPEHLARAANEGAFNGPYLLRALIEPDYWYDSLVLPNPEARQRFANLLATLDATVALAKSKNVPVYVAYLPSPFRYDPTFVEDQHLWRRIGFRVEPSWLVGELPLQRRLQAWADERDVPYRDLTAAFRARPESAPSTNFSADGHWNALGHEVAARALLEWLSEVQPRLAAKTSTAAGR